MRLSILDAQHTVFDGVVSEVTLPAPGEELTIMDNHEPLFVALSHGTIRLKLAAQKVELPAAGEEGEAVASAAKSFIIQQGVAHVRRNELVILVE